MNSFHYTVVVQNIKFTVNAILRHEATRKQLKHGAILFDLSLTLSFDLKDTHITNIMKSNQLFTWIIWIILILSLNVLGSSGDELDLSKESRSSVPTNLQLSSPEHMEHFKVILLCMPVVFLRMIRNLKKPPFSFKCKCPRRQQRNSYSMKWCECIFRHGNSKFKMGQSTQRQCYITVSSLHFVRSNGPKSQ